MAQLLDLAAHRAPVHYTVRLTHCWNGTVEVFVEDVSDDPRSKQAVAEALTRAALQFGAMPEVDALHAAALARVNALMGANAGSPEGDELGALAAAVQAYEQIRWPLQTGAE